MTIRDGMRGNFGNGISGYTPTSTRSFFGNPNVSKVLSLSAASRWHFIASLAISFASFKLSPSVTIPGNFGTVTVYPAPFGSKITSY